MSIVNEGLLVYLDEEEKRQLCRTIRDILKARGGYWITGDVYVKHDREETAPRHPVWDAFRKKHRIEENRFDSYDAAMQLFKDCGLEPVERLSLAPDKLSCLEWPGVNKEDVIRGIESKPAIRESWQLQAI